MRHYFKTVAKQTLKRFDIGVTSYHRLQELKHRSQAANDLEFLLGLPDRHSSQLLGAFRTSQSQLRQDLFVLSELNFKRNGFFVEFGATDGIHMSNTYLLEKQFGWNGILAEPARRWHEQLRANRRSRVETDCVWRDSTSILTFNEVAGDEPDRWGFSTIHLYSSADHHREERRHGTTYRVQTISLVDLLDKYSAPKDIDYLSIDTEGSEYEILRAFDFARYNFKVITCEHNFTPEREKIASLLINNGYVRKFPELSRIDDWYVRV